MPVVGCKQMPLALLAVSESIHARTGVDGQAVERYTDALKQGAEFDPMVSFYDGQRYWLAAGFLRHAALKIMRKPTGLVQVITGTRDEALAYAAGENSAHGLPRSEDDTERAVLMLLDSKAYGHLADSSLAKIARVLPSTVERVRRYYRS